MSIIKRYEEELKGKKFRGRWENSPIFTFGKLNSISVDIEWDSAGGPTSSSYGYDTVFELIENGTWILINEVEEYDGLALEHKKALEREIQHIFDSGANEIRIQEMVERFISQRGGLKPPEEKKWYKITYGSRGFGVGEVVKVWEFTPSELKEHLDGVGQNLGHPMLDEWVEKVENL